MQINIGSYGYEFVFLYSLFLSLFIPLPLVEDVFGREGGEGGREERRKEERREGGRKKERREGWKGREGKVGREGWEM